MSALNPTSAELDLNAWLEGMAQHALNRTDEELSQIRSTAYSRYMGEVYGNEEEGYSQVRTREVLETIEWAMPGLLRIFMHTSNVANFQPIGRNDIEAARIETRVVNRQFHKLGTWETLNAWFRDALMYPNGYSKVWWDDAIDQKHTRFEDMTPIQLGMLEQNEDVEIDEVRPAASGTTGLFDVSFWTFNTTGRIAWEAVPPEEVLVYGKHNRICLDSARWVAHYRNPTRGELLDMGIEEAVVMQLAADTLLDSSTERENRAKYQDEDPETSSYLTGIAELDEEVDWFESYGRVDWNDDGVQEYRKMCFSSGMVIVNEETDYQPLCALGAIPQSHRHTALSMFDLSEDVQEINTVQTRQMLDNLYRTNRPRQFAGRGVNVDQLMSYVPFGVVEMSSPDDVITENIPSVIQQVLPAMDQQRSNLEMRTGMSRMMHGMDADKLAQTTMGAYFEALGIASQRLEFIARCFGETGVKDVLLKMHHLLRTHQGSIQESLEVAGEWIDVSPTNWRERDQMEVKVGLGTGSQRERISSGMALLDVQKEALSHGLTTKSRIFSNLQEITEAMGKSDADMYFLDPRYDEAVELDRMRSQKEQEASQREQQNIEAAINAQVAPQMAKVQAEVKKNADLTLMKMNELRQKLVEAENQHMQAMAKLELEYNVDIRDQGVDSNDVTPLRSVSNNEQ